LILPPILSGYAADAIDSYNTVGAWMGYLSYSGGYSITVRTATYWVDQSTPSTTWDNTTWVNWDMLFQIIKNTDYMEKSNATEENMENYVAVAKILKAYGYMRIVDMYGRAPYSEAFQGSKNLYTKYDDGESIYDSCIAELNTAMDIIQNTGTETIDLGNDIMFGGDMDKWLRFANTLKLKFLIRESAVASDVASEISKTADIGYLEEDAMVNPGYSNSADKQNPLWGDLGVSAGGSLYSDGYNYRRGGGAMVDFYKDNNDPRLFYVYAPDGSNPTKSAFFTVDDDPGNYHGVYYGDRDAAADQSNGGTVGIGHGVMPGYDASVPLITAAESYFLQAEAALEGWISEDAEELYQKGITASFVYLYTQAGDDAGGAADDAEDYYNQNISLVSWAKSSNKKEAIIVQKWAALAITNNLEAWSEYRRTGYPKTDILPLTKYPSNTGREIPTKLMYPKSEADRNTGNYNDAVSKGNDPQSTKVFWMK